MIEQNEHSPDKVINCRRDGLFVGDPFNPYVEEVFSEKNAEINSFVHLIHGSADGKYDVITCTETIEHLTEPEAAVRSLLRSLSSKGVLVLTVPDGRIDHYKNHINFWSPESWKIFANKLSQGAFDVTVGTVQHPTVAALRYNWANFSRKGDIGAFQI